MVMRFWRRTGGRRVIGVQIETSPPNEDGMNEDGRRYVGPSQPLFDRPRKQIRRVSVGFESATAADLLNIRVLADFVRIVLDAQFDLP